jgi:hypothetical protein
MPADPEGVVTFEAAGKKFSAVFGFKAMKAVEIHFGDDNEPKPFFQAIAGIMPQLSPEDMNDKAKVAAASANIRFSDIGTLLQFALLKNHPEMTEADVEDLVDEIGIGKMSQVIGDALTAALVKEGDGSSPKNPPRSRKQPTG